MRLLMYLTTGGLVAAGVVVTAPAQPRGEQPPAASATGRTTCATSNCHTEVTLYQRVHQPVAEHRCDACHVPKEGATPLQPGVRHEFKRAGDDPELCYACHDRLGEDDFVHEPVKMGVCILCHDPHGAERASLLRFDTDRQLCAQCHRVTFDQGDHVHPPVRDGTCGACHDPHGSDHQKLLVERPLELCLDCHEAIEELLDEASVTHDTVTADRSCLACHDPHVSEVQRLLVGEPMGLCLSCHDKELESDEGRIRNIAAHLANNPNHHGPIRDKNCSACHNPHAGTVHRLLSEAYPVGPYAPFDEDAYALCFGCHDVEMVEEERDEEVTEFRNGDLNLHYVHVNREKQGTTCGACHDVHASKNPKHIADPTHFGEGAVPMIYEPSETGGSCQSGCHETWAYDRIQPVRNE